MRKIQIQVVLLLFNTNAILPTTLQYIQGHWKIDPDFYQNWTTILSTMQKKIEILLYSIS